MIFGSTSDEFNWITTGSIPVETENGQLKLKPDAQTTSFNRGLGVLDASNDRVHLQINLDLYRPQTSQQVQRQVFDEQMALLLQTRKDLAWGIAPEKWILI